MSNPQIELLCNFSYYLVKKEVQLTKMPIKNKYLNVYNLLGLKDQCPIMRCCIDRRVGQSLYKIRFFFDLRK